MSTLAPEALARLRPGLDDASISRLESSLGGLILPAELRAFYRWHNGQEWGDGLLPGFQLEPLESVAQRHPWPDFPPQWLELGNIGAPLYLVAICPFSPSDTCALMLIEVEGDSIELVWNSVASFIDSAEECFAKGVYRLQPGDLFFGVDEDRQDEIRRRHAGEVVIDGQTIPVRGSASDSDAWPTSWRSAAGIRDEDEVLRGATATVGEFNSARRAATIAGRVVWLAGTAGGDVVVVDDSTDRLTLAVPEGIVGSRYLAMRETFEFDIEPGKCPDSFAFVPGSAAVTAVTTRLRRVR
jgi:hypothetical protein